MRLTVQEMAYLVWGCAAGRRIMMVLRAAFDASMEHPCGVTTVAGYIADEAQWEAVERRWNGQLLLAELDKFHLSDIRKRFVDWLRVVKPFAEIARDLQLRSITASLKDTDWSALTLDPEYQELWPRREHACLDLLFGALADDVRLEFNNEPVAVVFDNDYGKTEAMFKVYDGWRERTGHPGFNIFVKGGVPWDSVPLQCADMVAGLLRLNPFSRAILDDDVRGLNDDDPLAEVANTALSLGSGVVWSAPIAKRVEAIRARHGE